MSLSERGLELLQVRLLLSWQHTSESLGHGTAISLSSFSKSWKASNSYNVMSTASMVLFFQGESLVGKGIAPTFVQRIAQDG